MHYLTKAGSKRKRMKREMENKKGEIEKGDKTENMKDMKNYFIHKGAILMRRMIT